MKYLIIFSICFFQMSFSYAKTCTCERTIKIPNPEDKIYNIVREIDRCAYAENSCESSMHGEILDVYRYRKNGVKVCEVVCRVPGRSEYSFHGSGSNCDIANEIVSDKMWNLIEEKQLHGAVKTYDKCSYN